MDVVYTPVTIDGVSGYFLNDAEYHKLYRAATGDERDEYVENLELELDNYRNGVQSLVAGLRNLTYEAGNI